MPKNTGLIEQLRDAVRNADVSRYRIAKETGVSEPALCRFVQGGGLTMEGIDAVAEFLRLELTTQRKRKRKPKPKGK